jgi:hypothetical protein
MGANAASREYPPGDAGLPNYRLGHVQPGAPGVYSHPTPEMRAELVGWLESVWHSWNPQELIARFERSLGVDRAMQQSITRNLAHHPTN